MWDSCVMTWKTFLNLFKKNYECFCFDGKKWYLKKKSETFDDLYIHLQFTDDFIKDGIILFYNHFQSSITFIEEEDFYGILQTRVQ